MFGCQQVLLDLPPLQKNILEFLCEQANKLVKCATFNLRQAYFAFKVVNYNAFELMAYMKENVHFKILYSQVGQQIIHGVAESFKSFNELTSKFFRGELAQKPKLPSYRKKGGLAGFTYPKQALKFDCETGLIRLPLGNEFKSWFNIDAVYLPMPTNLKFNSIRELRILPRNRCFYAEFVYEQPVVEVFLDKTKVLGIDPGLNNWLTCVSNVGTSFIIDGKHVKSLNRWYNKQVSVIKEKKPQGFWSKKLAGITEKRNRQMRDAVNKAARLVINHCLEHQIGTIVFGWNQQNKDGIELGKKNNQSFVQVPTARLKERISQLCKQYGIQFVETEESYTSKSSFLDNDCLPTYDEKLKEQSYKFSGKRVHRGLYRTAHNWYINADANGAANILRKVTATLGFDLSRVDRGALTRPQRFFLWSAKLKRSSAALAHCFASA
jgi:IS605 OrfB family transposase